MPKKSEKSDKPIVSKKEEYSITIDCAGKKYVSKGDSFYDCLMKIEPVEPIKGFAMINAQFGKTKQTVKLFSAQIKRLCINKNYKLILSKRLTMAL